MVTDPTKKAAWREQHDRLVLSLHQKNEETGKLQERIARAVRATNLRAKEDREILRKFLDLIRSQQELNKSHSAMMSLLGERIDILQEFVFSSDAMDS